MKGPKVNKVSIIRFLPRSRCAPKYYRFLSRLPLPFFSPFFHIISLYYVMYQRKYTIGGFLLGRYLWLWNPSFSLFASLPSPPFIPPWNKGLAFWSVYICPNRNKIKRQRRRWRRVRQLSPVALVFLPAILSTLPFIFILFIYLSWYISLFLLWSLSRSQPHWKFPFGLYFLVSSFLSFVLIFLPFEAIWPKFPSFPG